MDKLKRYDLSSTGGTIEEWPDGGYVDERDVEAVVRDAFIAGAKWGTELDIYVANEDPKYYLPVVHKAANEYLKRTNLVSPLKAV